MTKRCDITATLTDTHVHLDDRQFNKDRDRVIQRALEAGVQFLINVGTDVNHTRASISLAERYPAIYATAGLHPHDAGGASDVVLSDIEGLARHPKVVAIGEMGLDFFRDYAPRADQRRVFREQIRLSRRLGLPLVIHSRAADEETIAILRDEGADEVGGVLHCFPGDMAMAEAAIAMNFLLGIGGSITRNPERLEVACEIPLEHLVLETDCPYLTPKPHRGRNEPAFVRTVAERLARAKGVSLDDVLTITGQNALDVFHLA